MTIVKVTEESIEDAIKSVKRAVTELRETSEDLYVVITASHNWPYCLHRFVDHLISIQREIEKTENVTAEIQKRAEKLLNKTQDYLHGIQTSSLEQGETNDNVNAELHGDNDSSDEPTAGEYNRGHISIDETLAGASEDEREIYNNANLKKGNINGRDCLIRTDLNTDPSTLEGLHNLILMSNGNAPWINGEPVDLHHIGQQMNSPLAELKIQEHRGAGNDAILHNKSRPSEINRSEFIKERRAYWQARARSLGFRRK